MPTPRLDNILCEYTFTKPETIIARILTPLQIMWLQNKYALLFKQKGSTQVPEDGVGDRSYLLIMGELEGKLGMIMELLEDCKQASIEQQTENFTGQQEEGEVAASLIEIKSVEDRASQYVHNQQ
jgi:hypothetical protein